MIVVFHVDDETVHFNNGAIHVAIPPHEPVEIHSDYDAKVLLQEKNFHGIVEVHQIKTKTGVSYDVDDAENRAEEALAVADEKSIRDYVEAQFEDRIKSGKPALPPAKGSRTARLVTKYKVNFKDQFGLDISAVNTQRKFGVAPDPHIEEMQKRLEELEQTNAELKAQNDAILAELKKMTVGK